jgi:hypothetical protein
MASKFLVNLKQFLDNIVKNYPEQEKKIRGYYRDLDENVEIYLNEFYENCKNKGSDIASKNEIIFSKESVILPGIDFYTIWNDEKLDEEQRDNIWKYLHTLYILAYEHKTDRDISDFIKFLKEGNIEIEKMDEQTRTMVDIIHRMLTGVDDKNKEVDLGEDEPEEDDGKPLFDLPDLMDGTIGKLAKEIAEEIDPASLNLNVENPQQLISELMSGNFDETNDKSGIVNLVKNITSKVQNKIQSGEFSESQLFEEAKGMMEKLQKGGKKKGPMGNMLNGLLKNLPKMAGMEGMPPLNPEQLEMLQQATQVMSGGNAGVVQKKMELKGTRDRLRAKLEEKRRLEEEKNVREMTKEEKKEHKKGETKRRDNQRKRKEKEREPPSED